MKKITEEKLAEIKNNATKPTIFNGNFPLNEISDREFEALCYLLFKERIKYDDIELTGKFDKIDLMSGVGEKGFDSTLYLNNKIVGLVQCKKHKTRLTKPQVIKELLKFVLNTILNPNLLPDKKKFTYYIISSSGFANTTIALLSNFNKKIEKEDIKKYCCDVISQNKGLTLIDIDVKLSVVLDILKSIKVIKIIPEDLNIQLKEYSIIAKSFFKVYTATDNTLIEKVITKYLEPLINNVSKEGVEIKDYQFRFKEYLSQALNTYSSAQTLVFGNQQKKIEDFYYPLTLTCKKESEKPIKIKTHKFSDEFIPNYKKVLICDHGGMGKSTILKWLFRSATVENKGIPIFIELRSLSNKNTIINEITKQLEPINIKIEEKVTRDLIAKGGFIFFFDGYDEISKKNKKEVTKDMSSFISKASLNLFVISSRPESALKTFGDFQEFNIDRLKTNEAYELIKKIGNNNPKSIQLIEQLKKDTRKELTEFLESPLLISLLYKKFEHRETIPLKKQEFYWEVFEALFQAHDIIKGDRYEREKESNLTLYEFHKILRGLAYFTALLNQVEFNHAELEKFLKKTNDFFPGVKFQISNFINDITSAVPIFQKEGLKYKWAHKTLQEYFASEFICRDTKEKQGGILERLSKDENSLSYYGIIDMCFEIDFKSFRKYILYPICKDYSNYYNTSLIKFKDDQNFNLIVNLANQIYSSKLAFFKIDDKSFSKLFSKMEKFQGLLQKEFQWKASSIEIMVGGIATKEDKLNVALLKINKGFNIKKFIKEKKINLLEEIKPKRNKNPKLIDIKYNKVIDDVDFYFIPDSIEEFIEQHLDELESYYENIGGSNYCVKACEKLIKEVEKEKEKEDNLNYFF